MIQFTVPSGDFKLFIESFGALIVDAKLHITPIGLTVTSIDAANVALVTASYSIPTNVTEEIIVGIEPEKLRKLLTIIESGELKITINNGFLTIKNDLFESEMRLVDINTIRKEPTIPTFELQSHFTDSAKIIPTALKKIMSLGGEKISFQINNDSVTLKCGDDVDDKLKRVINSTEISDISGTATGLYSKDYLTSMEGILKKLYTTTYHMKTDHPIKIISKNEPGTINVMYLIAPRIETDIPA